ncbi:MAG: hypothetical protein HZA54_01400 [Planctomycetes bacterium]|nr:hypothetical protein [Planctomycetota bacterium]
MGSFHRPSGVRPFIQLLFLAAGLFTAGRAEAMTTAELVAELKKLGADEAALIAAYPATIDESRPDFLGGAAYLKVTVRHPNHPHVMRFVRATGGALYRLTLGAAEVERMQAELKPAPADADAALRYVQWLLGVTEGGAFWLVANVADVPFLPERKDDPDRAAALAKARAELAKKLAPPATRAETEGFAVEQCAVRKRDLVRYVVRVTRDGRTTVKRETLAADLPVVMVIGD